MIMDEMDRQIIEILRQLPRATNKSIAASIGVSEPTVAHRIRKMVSEKVIRFTLQRNAEQHGFTSHAIVYLQIVGRRAAEVARDVSEIEQVISVIQAEGDADVIVLVSCRGREDIDYLVNQRIASIAGVQSISFDLSLRILKTQNHLTRAGSQFLGLSQPGMSI